VQIAVAECWLVDNRKRLVEVVDLESVTAPRLFSGGHADAVLCPSAVDDARRTDLRLTVVMSRSGWRAGP
jgi:hypothetical protein